MSKPFVTVRIRRRPDGEERDYKFESVHEWGAPIGDHIQDNADVDRWMWSEGNYACDCNRASFFADAGGEPDPDVQCGDDNYIVVWIKTPDGKIVYSDEID